MTVIFDESASVRTAAELKNSLMDAFQSGEVICDLTNLKRVDCAVGQLLVSVLREGKKKNVPVKFKGLMPRHEQQIKLCGLKKP